MYPAERAHSVVVVTGAASGIGSALSRRLTERGSTVALLDCDEQRLMAVAAQITARGGCGHPIVCDVSHEPDVCGAFAQIEERLGPVDSVFNCAGLEINGDVLEVDPIRWRTGLAVDLDGTILVSRTAYQAMLKRGAGHIVTVASLAGLVPLPGLAYYSAAKHAVVAFSLALRAEARSHGVRVSVACPALVDTPLRMNTAAYLERPVFPAPRLRWPRPISADRCALAILRGVARNAAVIPVPAYAGWIWLMYRLAPDWIAGLAVAAGRRMRRPYDEG